jgi:hypothetical protein
MWARHGGVLAFAMCSIACADVLGIEAGQRRGDGGSGATAGSGGMAGGGVGGDAGGGGDASGGGQPLPCELLDLAATFDGPELDPGLAATGDPDTFYAVDDVLILRVAPGMDVPRSHTVFAEQGFDLRDKCLSVQVVNGLSTPEVRGFFGFQKNAANPDSRYRFQIDDDELHFLNIDENITTSVAEPIPYLSDGGFLRFRHRSSPEPRLVWETSADGITWVPRATITGMEVFLPSQARPLMSIYTDAQTVDASIRLDNLNVIP